MVPLVKGGKYDWTRVGYSRPLMPREEIPFAFIEDGTVQVRVAPGDIRFTPAERAAGRARVPRIRFPGPPIVLEGALELEGVNFEQAAPHTEVFQLAAGAVVVFRDCRLINVTVPDGVTIDGGNLQHGHSETLDGVSTFTLCECDKCVSARLVLARRAVDGTLPMVNGRVQHHELKAEIRDRRPVTEQERAAAVADNEAARAEAQIEANLVRGAA